MDPVEELVSLENTVPIVPGREQETTDQMDWRQLLAEGHAAVGDEDYHRALQISDKVAQAGEDARYYAAILRGHVLLELGDATAALSSFESVADPNVVDPDIDLARGIAHFHLVQFPEAVNALYSSLRGRPDVAEAYYTLALIAELQGTEDEVELFRRARQLEPERFAPKVQRSWQAFELCIEEAVADLPGAFQKFFENIPILLMEVPHPDDLKRTSPPIPPTCLTLYIAEEDPASNEPLPSLLLFKKNFERTYRTDEELIAGINRALYEEARHLFDLSSGGRAD